MEFGVLGPLSISGPGVGRVSSPLQCRLLALLLSRGGQPVREDVLVHGLWPEPTSTAANRLHIQVHRLRKALDDRERIVLEQGGYRLRVYPGELDAERFETLRANGLEALGSGHAEEAARSLRGAIGLWRGEAYADLADQLALTDESGRLTELRISALEALYDAELRCGTGPTVIAELADVAVQYPLRERFHAQRMIALLHAGRRADALVAYSSARAQLVDQLGIEPGAELRQLQSAALAGEGIPAGRGVLQGSAPVPAQLPPGVAGFAARERDLASLGRLLDDGSQVGVITGIAGVGKTALVLRWSHSIRDQFPDGQLYVDLRGFSSGVSLMPSEVLVGFLRALGVSDDEVPTSEAEQAGLYRSLLVGRRMLVVLDNAVDVAQVRPLLPSAPGTVTVITSRSDLRGLSVSHDAVRAVLSPLGLEDSRRVLEQVLGTTRVGREPEAADVLANLCGGLPLSLRIASANVSSVIDRPLTALADALGAGERLSELAVEGDPQANVRRSFELTYLALDDEAQIAFRRIGATTGADFSIELLASLCVIDLRTARRLVRGLESMHLVEELPSGRFRQHDLIRLYAEELAEREPDRMGVLGRLVDWYLRSAINANEPLRTSEGVRADAGPPVAGCIPFEPAEDTSALDWFDDEWAGLQAVLDRVEGTEHRLKGWLLVSTFHQYLASRRYWHDNTAVYERAVASVRSAGDDRQLARLLAGLGNAYSDVARWTEAEGAYQEMLRLATERGDPRGVATALANLGNCMHMSNRPADAVPYLREALGLVCAEGLETQEAFVRANLSTACTRSGDPGDGRAHAEVVLAFSRERGFRWLEGFALTNLGEAYHHLGELDRAVDLMRQSLAILRELDLRRNEAKTLALLAETLRDRGDLQQARAVARQGLEICGSQRAQDAVSLRERLRGLAGAR